MSTDKNYEFSDKTIIGGKVILTEGNISTNTNNTDITINPNGNGRIILGNNLVVNKLSSNPITNIVSGMLYYNTVEENLKVYNGTTWVSTSGDVTGGLNVGIGGVGLFKQESATGVLEFRNLNTASNKLSVSLDVINDEVDIDLVQSNITGTGVLDSGSVTSGFGEIDNGTSNIKSVNLYTDNLNEYTNLNGLNLNNNLKMMPGVKLMYTDIELFQYKNGSIYWGLNAGENNSNSVQTNIGIGTNALRNSDGGSFNICIGAGCGSNFSSTCQQNYFVGINNGLTGITNVQDMIVIGTTAMNNSDNYSNTIVLGDGGNAGVIVGNNASGPKRDNIYIRTFGGSVPDSESGYIRIQDGDTSTITNTYIGGIVNSSASGSNRLIVGKTTDNRLESIPDGTSGQVPVTNGTGTIGFSSTTSITGTGPLNVGSITSGFGEIDNGSSNIKSTNLFSDTIQEYTVGGPGIQILNNTWIAQDKFFSFLNNVLTAPPEFSIGMNGTTRNLYFSGTDDWGYNGFFRFGYFDSTATTWTESMNLNCYTGRMDLSNPTGTLFINGQHVLSETGLGAAVINSSLTTVGALASGSIASGFGSINNGANSITTTGQITGGQIVVDNLDLNGNTISSTDVNGDINLSPNGTGSVVSSKNIEITSSSSPRIIITDTSVVASIWNIGSDGIRDGITFLNNVSTEKFFIGETVNQSAVNFSLSTGNQYQINATKVLDATSLGTSVVTSSLTTVGVLNSGSITSGFGEIDNGSSNIKSTNLFSDTIQEYTVGGPGIQILNNTWIAQDKFFSFLNNVLTAPPEFSIGMNNTTRDLYFSGTDDFFENGFFRFGYFDSTATTWTESMNLNCYTGRMDLSHPTGTLFINGQHVLSETGLGSAVINSSLTTVGALNSGSITSGFGSINNGANSITTTGQITAGNLVVDNIDLNTNTIQSTTGDLALRPASLQNLILDGWIWPTLDGSNGDVITTNGTKTLSFSRINKSVFIGGNVINTVSATYVTTHRWVYQGSSNTSTILSIKALVDPQADTMNVRVYDNTNSTVICELTGITGTGEVSISLGTISNVPTGEAIFYLQHFRSAGVTGNVLTYGCLVA